MTKTSSSIPAIAIDAMGGDYAPLEIVKGAYKAAKDLKVKIILVGDVSKINEILSSLGSLPNIEVLSAKTHIEMRDKATKGIRNRETSIAICAGLVKDRAADAMISAGNTGAVMSAATMIIGRIKGVPRPALAVILPTKKPVLVLDVGANAICKPQYLQYFGLLGSAYMESVLGVKNPSVGLLNIGEEEGKGNELVNNAYELLQRSNLNFVGNVEGHMLPRGACDVVVCDGFTGNIVLKVLEGAAELIGSMLKTELTRTFVNKVGALFLSPGLRSLYQNINPDKYGGAQLLGIEGMCIITHGRSKEPAIYNSIKIALKEIEEGLLDKIKTRLTTFEAEK